MARSDSTFTFGIEEEYLLVDRETRDLVSEIPDTLLAACKKGLGKQFSREYMRAQIEVGTPVCSSMNEARHFLEHSRQRIAKIADEYDFAPIAASTHPFARWGLQMHTDLPRYNSVAEDLQGLGRRMIINGLHVHVGVSNNADRIRLMNAVRPYLPIFLALSTSSPFWQGEATGLKSYRTAINDATPRKGIPEAFASWRDYERTIRLMCKSGVIEDATKIWWDVRPSANFPTLEMRITDVTPHLEDGLCLAALFRCLCRYLLRSAPSSKASSAIDAGVPSLLVINENRWRAQRYGIHAGQIDYRTGHIVPFKVLIEDMLLVLHDTAEELECLAELAHVRTILDRGTSADRQLDCYSDARDGGLTRTAAINSVVDLLIEETVAAARSTRAPLVRPVVRPVVRNAGRASQAEYLKS